MAARSTEPNPVGVANGGPAAATRGLRTSSYVIRIASHEAGRTILVHGYTGAIDVVDEDIVALLDRWREGTLQAAPAETVEALRRRGYLTDVTHEEEVDRVRTMLSVLLRKRRSFHSFTFVPTYDCNLRCPYCYQKHLETRGREWLEAKVDHSRIDAAFRLMDALAGPEKSWINLYGGEPFQAKNKSAISYFLDQALAKGYRVHAISNGVEVDHFLEHFGPGRIRTIQITIDGPPEVHDQRRIRGDGGPSFWQIVGNVRRLLELGVEVRIRVNIDRSNVTGVPVLRQIFQEAGLSDAPGFSVHFYPVRSFEKKRLENHYDPAELAGSIDELGGDCGDDPGLGGRHVHQYIQDWFLESVRNNRPMRFVGIACDASTAMAVFDPFGGIYPCWDVVGQPEHMIGAYFPEVVWRDEALERWRGRTPANMPTCLKCPYVMYCGGGCTWLSHTAHDDFLAPTCGETRFKQLFRRHIAEANRILVDAPAGSSAALRHSDCSRCDGAARRTRPRGLADAPPAARA